MRTRIRGRHWRRNPLRRRSDVVEAWTKVLVALLLFVAAPALGAATAWWGHGQAQAIVAEQRAERHHVRATVVDRTPAPCRPESSADSTYRATVHWKAPDGTEKSTTARVPADTRHGDTVDVWLDSRGQSVPPPSDSAEIWQHSATIGSFTTIGTVLTVLLAHRAVRAVAMRHRMAEWDRDWALTEPQWTHRRA